MMKPVTQAAVLVETGKPLELWELEIPALKPGQVLVDICFSGVCHTQINEVQGKKGPDKFLPHCLGHEGVGRVSAVGESVTKVHTGETVVLSWIKSAGAEVPSTQYSSARGAVNSGALATFMRHTVTCESRVIPISPDVPLPEAAMLGCAVPTGAGVVLNTMRVTSGDTIAVFGAGGIGVSAILAARGIGAKRVIAIDIVPDRLSRALELGATDAIDARSEDPVEKIRHLTSGQGVDFAVEAAGRPATMEAAFESVRRGGGLCVLAGNLPHGQTIRIDPFSLIAGKRIVGTWGGESYPDRDIPLFIEMFQAGRLKLGALVSEIYPLARINEALDALSRGVVLRPLIDMNLEG